MAGFFTCLIIFWTALGHAQIHDRDQNEVINTPTFNVMCGEKIVRFSATFEVDQQHLKQANSLSEYFKKNSEALQGFLRKTDLPRECSQSGSVQLKMLVVDKFLDQLRTSVKGTSLSDIADVVYNIRNAQYVTSNQSLPTHSWVRIYLGSLASIATGAISDLCPSKYSFIPQPGRAIDPRLDSNKAEVCQSTDVLDHLLEANTRRFSYCFDHVLLKDPTLGRTSVVEIPLLLSWSDGKVDLIYPLRLQDQRLGELRICIKNVMGEVNLPKNLRSIVFSGTLKFRQ